MCLLFSELFPTKMSFKSENIFFFFHFLGHEKREEKKYFPQKQEKNTVVREVKREQNMPFPGNFQLKSESKTQYKNANSLVCCQICFKI